MKIICVTCVLATFVFGCGKVTTTGKVEPIQAGEDKAFVVEKQKPATADRQDSGREEPSPMESAKDASGTTQVEARVIPAPDMDAATQVPDTPLPANKKLIKAVRPPEDAAQQKEPGIARISAAHEKQTSELMQVIKGVDRPAAQEEVAAEQELMAEITGLIIEETMTKLGYEFYEYFFLFWEPPQIELKDYNILITERASPRWGSWVQVAVNEDTVWSNMLRPRSAEIEDAVQQAVAAAKDYLVNYEKYQFQTEDMVGSGI